MSHGHISYIDPGTVASVNVSFEAGAWLIKPFTFADDCTCPSWFKSYGDQRSNVAEQNISFFVFALTCANLVYYLINAFRATAGWEEMFVCIIEGFAAAISAWPQISSPYTLYLSTGQRVQWIRYFEWLMTCPVILIHLSNLTGLKHHYSTRTMALIVSDIGCIVTGVTCALSNGYGKVIWFVVSCGFGLVTYTSAYQVYKESYAVVPDRTSKRIVLTMACIYYVTWTLYPILFALGPEGFQVISYYAMNVGYTLNDMFSKNLWGLLGHTLRLRAFDSSQSGWVMPRSRSSMDIGSMKNPQDQQAWVAGMQDFTSNMMLLLAEMHKRVKGEDPDMIEEDSMPGGVGTKLITAGSGASMASLANRRKSLGDMVAEDVIRCAKGRASTGGPDVDQEMARKSREALKVLLGENYDKVMELMAAHGGLPAVLAAGSADSTPRPTDNSNSPNNNINTMLIQMGSVGTAPYVPASIVSVSSSRRNSIAPMSIAPAAQASLMQGLLASTAPAVSSPRRLTIGSVVPQGLTSGGSSNGSEMALLASPITRLASARMSTGSVKFSAELPPPVRQGSDLRTLDL